MHTDYLFILERTHSLDARLMPDALRGLDRAFLKRRWVIRDGHLTSIQVPVFDSEEEVEVEINEEGNFFLSHPWSTFLRPDAATCGNCILFHQYGYVDG